MLLTPEISRRVFQKSKIFCIAFMIAAVALGIASPGWAKSLTIGTISSTPTSDIRIFRPFADYLSSTLTSDGIDTIKVVAASSIQEMAALLQSGEVDLYIDSSVTALAVNKLSGAQFMLRRWKKGRNQYRSVIFVRQDSDIIRLADLRDKVIAFEEPFSTSGFLLPALSVRRQGLVLSAVASPRTAPPAGQVGYLMAHDNEVQAVWVERGRVQAAAMAEDDFKNFAKSALNPLRVLYQTPYVPYHVVVHRSGLDARLVTRIKTVLKSAHETQHGQSVLLGFGGTTMFDDIPEAMSSNIIKLEPILGLLNAPQ